MAGKNSKEDKKEGGFLRFLYNPDTKEVLGRTGLSWFKITVFYIIFYACLTAFWTIMLIVFYQTLDGFEPKWTLDASTIGTVPGLGFRPRPPESTVDSTLIYFKAGTGGTWENWVKDLETFTKDYSRQAADGANVQSCSFDGPRASKDKACKFALEDISANCSSAQKFGYEYGQPCVLLKLNKIYGWEPEPYSNDSLPQNMPDSIKKVYDGRNIYISCEGENVADQENMGPLAFYPGNYIQNYYYPYKNVPGYMSPFVFVQFMRPERGVLINLECKAWAANIKHDRQDRVGSVHFELMID